LTGYDDEPTNLERALTADELQIQENDEMIKNSATMSIYIYS